MVKFKIILKIGRVKVVISCIKCKLSPEFYNEKK